MWLFSAVESNMRWSNVLKTPFSTQTCNTVLAIAFESPAPCGKPPPFTLSILITHFSVSWQILRSPSDGSLRPPFDFHVTNRSGTLSLVVFNALYIVDSGPFLPPSSPHTQQYTILLPLCTQIVPSR